jgi:addiction module HigA family antidote
MTTQDEIFLAPRDGFPFEPVHPGEVLLDELAARGLTAHALALKLRVPANRLTEILNGKRGISPETALRLSRYLGPSATFWWSLQGQYDLARAEKRFGAKIKAEVEAA